MTMAAPLAPAVACLSDLVRKAKKDPAKLVSWRGQIMVQGFSDAWETGRGGYAAKWSRWSALSRFSSCTTAACWR